MYPWASHGEDPTIVARVNGEALLHTELRRVKVDLTNLLENQESSVRSVHAKGLDRVAMRMLVQRKLMLQEAARRELSVGEDELDAAISELRQRFGELEDFGQWLTERGLDDRSLLETVKDDILVARVTDAIAAAATVTSEQIADYYEAHQGQIAIGEQVRVGIIAVGSHEAGRQVLEDLRSGASFVQLARARSVAPGVYTEWMDPLNLPLQLRQAIGELREGDVVGPIRKAEDEFVIVGVAGRRPVVARNAAEARHEIEKRLMPAAKQLAMSQWLVGQEELAKIEIYLERG